MTAALHIAHVGYLPGRVLAGMNVNVWEVNEAIQAIVRGGRAVDAARLADVDVPAEEFLG